MATSAKKTTGKATISKAAAKRPAAKTIARTPAAQNHTKADIARTVFAKCYGMKQVPARKEILARVQAEAGLTEKGAATYLQNYRRDQGWVGAR